MAEPSKHTSRLFLLDRKSGQKFLIDSGSEICVIPPSPTMNKSPQSNFSLFAANNTKIPAYGMVRKELNLGLRRPFIWTFIIADVSSPIIGADFLKHFNLLIDLKKKRLVDVETSLFTSCVFSNIVQPSILTVDANISFKNILSEYPDLSNPSLISKSATHVFLRRDMLRRPLQQPYDGPFKVLQGKDKVFFLDINGKRVSVSIDRCKPAFFLNTEDFQLPQTKNETPATVEPNATASTPAAVESDPTASTPTQPSTRSGRKVHLPTRYR
ncbi:peptidase A2 domain-containing protein [Trichonephila clavipes]|nr:peptidase A2 domain-containing protein [Trichonephila clavipes]